MINLLNKAVLLCYVFVNWGQNFQWGEIMEKRSFQDIWLISQDGFVYNTYKKNKSHYTGLSAPFITEIRKAWRLGESWSYFACSPSSVGYAWAISTTLVNPQVAGEIHVLALQSNIHYSILCKIKDRQPKSYGLPGFELYCDEKLHRTLLEFPSVGNFAIDYLSCYSKESARWSGSLSSPEAHVTWSLYQSFSIHTTLYDSILAV